MLLTCDHFILVVMVTACGKIELCLRKADHRAREVSPPKVYTFDCRTSCCAQQQKRVMTQYATCEYERNARGKVKGGGT
jgi:hypothetical protein